LVRVTVSRIVAKTRVGLQFRQIGIRRQLVRLAQAILSRLFQVFKRLILSFFRHEDGGNSIFNELRGQSQRSAFSKAFDGLLLFPSLIQRHA